MLSAGVSQADQRLQQVGAGLLLREMNGAEQLEVLNAVWVSVLFEGAVRRSGGVVPVEELQVGIGGEAQVHVPAEGVVHSGGRGVREALQRIVVKEVSGLICVLVEVSAA